MIRGGIQAKLFFVIAALAVTTTLALTIGGWRWYEATATRELERKALTYAQLLSHSVESAVEFEDQVTAREAFDAVMVDSEISAVAVFRSDGTLLAGRGDHLALAAGAATASTPSIVRSSDRVTCQLPVVAREGPRGMAVVVVSRGTLQAQLHVLRAVASILALCTMGCGFLVAWWLSRSLARRIARVADAAAEVASGSLAVAPVADDSLDEVGRLAAAFNAMVAELRRLVQKADDTAAEEQGRLEKLVSERTGELATRNRAMRQLLDHVGEGFLMLDLKGCIGEERSAAVDRWFGKPSPDVPFWKQIAPLNEAYALWFEMSWEAFCDGSLPAEVAVEQFPKRLQIGARSYDVAVTPLLHGETIAQTILHIRDITPQLEQERVESLQREVLALLERALDDRVGYLAFMAETGAITESITREKYESLVDVTRAVHTLKGNCGLFGLTSLASFCHDLETRMSASGGPPSKDDRAELAKRWFAATARLNTIFSKQVDTLSVERGEVDALVDGLADGASRAELLRRSRMLRLDSVDARVRQIAEQAAILAENLDKNVDVSVDGAGLRFDPVTWGPFWASFAHVMRNALDHGIESPARRARAGKPEAGAFAVRGRLEGDRFVIEVRDDGGGIDWSVLAERARERGLPTATRADLEEALFVDGFSTKEEVDEISGRGVGLGAVRAHCVALGGFVTVASQLGAGTTFRFDFPRAALGDAYADTFEGSRAVA